MRNEKFSIYGVMLTLPYLSLVILIIAYFADRNAVSQNPPEILEKPYPKLDFNDEQSIDDSDDKKLSTLNSIVIKKLAKEQKWSCSKGALGNWKVIQTPHFYITSEASRDENFIAAFCLEEFMKDIKKILPIEREPLFNVRIFKSNGQFKSYAKTRECASATSFYDADRREIVASAKGNFASDILHEAVHAYLAYNFNNTPVWFSEGLAEYFANFEVNNNNIKFGAPSKRYISILQKEQLISLDELMHLDKEAFYKGNYKLAYAQSWTVVWLWLNNKEVMRTIGFQVTF